MPNKTRIPQALVSQSEVDAIALLLDKILPDQPLLKDENIGVQIVSTAGRDNPDHVLCAPTLDALRVALADKFAVWNRDQLIIEFVITNTDGLGLLDDRALIETRCPKSDGSTRRRLVYVWRGHSGYYAWSSFPWDPIHKPCGPLDKMVKIAPPTQEELDTVSQQLETFVTQIIPNHTVDTRKHAVAEYENRMDRARKPFPKLLYSKSTEDIKVKLKCLLDEWHKIDPIAGLRWSVDKHFYPEVGTRCMVFETIPRNNGGAYYRIYFWRLKFGYYSSMSLYLKPKSATNGGCFIATACYGSHDAPSVRVLREFRDDILLSRKWGRLFVEEYYRHSPPAAAIIANSALLRFVFRHFVIQPMVWLVWLCRLFRRENE